MTEAILSTRGLTKRFGGLVATDNVSLEIAPGEIHAIIGPNGAGKTTLLAQLSGELRPDAGSILFRDREITRMPADKRARLGIARSFQITSIFRDASVLDNAALAVQAHRGHSFRFWRPARRDDALRLPAMAALERTGLAGRAEVSAANLSHGEQRQLEIAMALAAGPSLLLLDEPMAGMGGEEAARMVELLRALKGRHTVLLIEHDMDAVFSLADRITVLLYGRGLATGTPEEIRNNAAVREAYLGETPAVAS